MCHHHPNGVSPRFAVVNADGYDDCTAFAYCIDGDYVTEECTPGQYFDASIGKKILRFKIIFWNLLFSLFYKIMILFRWMSTIG